MGKVRQNPEVQYFVWRSPFSLTTEARLMSSSNSTGDMTTNNFKIGALLMQILLFAPRMASLAHIHTYIDNTAAQVWAKRGSVSTASSVGPILQELQLAARRQHIHASVGRVLGEDNNMADAASRITHLLDRQFISPFRTHFPNSKPWRLIYLTSGYKRKLTTMLRNKKPPRGSMSPYPERRHRLAPMAALLQLAPNSPQPQGH